MPYIPTINAEYTSIPKMSHNFESIFESNFFIILKFKLLLVVLICLCELLLNNLNKLIYDAIIF